MEKLEEIAKICTLKKMSLDKNSTTFKPVKEGHELYKCIKCKGTPGSCKDYTDYNKLKYNYNISK